MLCSVRHVTHGTTVGVCEDEKNYIKQFLIMRKLGCFGSARCAKGRSEIIFKYIYKKKKERLGWKRKKRKE